MTRTATACLLFAAALGACRAPASTAGPAADPAPASGLSIRAAPLPGPEATSLLGQPLERSGAPPSPEATANLEAALRDFFDDPLSHDALLWLGRRYGYLMRYREAQAVFTQGLRQFPDSAQLLRHRGHRWITLRRLDDAVHDLQAAGALVAGTPDALEPDGAPNALGIPRSTHQSNIWYHLGLAHYLLGDFQAARDAYERCLELSRVNDDMLCATTAWLWATLKRLGRDEEARLLLEPIHADMDVIENHAYYDLLRFYRGDLGWSDLAPESGARASESIVTATTLYGLANWLLLEGRRDEARTLFEDIVRSTNWAAFGHVAAEAELARWE